MSDITITPKGLERQRRILESAKEVFFEVGFEKASVAEIMRRSGGSISSLYNLYGNKVGVFRAMIQQVTEDVFAEFDADGFWTDDIETSLKRFAEHMIGVFGREDAICLSRIISGSSGKDKDEINQIFFEAGPQYVRGVLASYLRAQQSKGHIDGSLDPYIAATQFIAMIKEPWFSGIEVGAYQAPEVKEQAVAHAISLFVKGAVVSKD